MNILLIDPVTTAETLQVGKRRRLRQEIGYPGLGLITVAALTPPGANVRIIDESVEEISLSPEPDLIGISVQCPTAPYAYKLAGNFRERGIPVVLGGIHVSLNPEEARRHADSVVIGEAELTWPRLVRDFRDGSLQSTYRAPALADLDASPRPRRDLLRDSNYQLPTVVQASKGCRFGCEYCSLYSYVGYKPRFREIERVLAEIRELEGDTLLFIDDNLYIDREYTKLLLTGLVGMGKRWVAEATWNIAFDEEILRIARQSGCLGLFIGFDSLNRQYMMSKVPAKDTETLYMRSIRNIQDHGIAVVAAFVFGLDSDDKSVFDRSLNVVVRGGANLVNFSALVPYPGTPIYSRLRSEGRITEWDWSKYISPNVCFTPRHMTADELHEGTLGAQREFYSLKNIVETSLRTFTKLGWGMSLLSLKLNFAQKKNWGKGATD